MRTAGWYALVIQSGQHRLDYPAQDCLTIFSRHHLRRSSPEAHIGSSVDLLPGFDLKDGTIAAKPNIGEQVAASVLDHGEVPLAGAEGRPPIMGETVRKPVERDRDVVVRHALVQMLRDVDVVEKQTQVGHGRPLLRGGVVRLLPLNRMSHASPPPQQASLYTYQMSH